jgi:hypothetical protein
VVGPAELESIATPADWLLELLVNDLRRETPSMVAAVPITKFKACVFQEEPPFDAFAMAFSLSVGAPFFPPLVGPVSGGAPPLVGPVSGGTPPC